MKQYLFFSIAVIVFSCRKGELPKPVSADPAANVVSVSMGSDYANQLFFSLTSGTVVFQNNRETWDLAFWTGADEDMITMNSSKFMAVSMTGKTDLTEVTSAAGAVWKYDPGSGRRDSLALNNWELNQVYLLDRGLNTLGQQIGKVKFQITAASESSYTIRWGKVGATSGFQEFVVMRTTSANADFVSLNDSGNVVQVEPETKKWDLCFSSYTHIYPDMTPYLVNGVRCNRGGTNVFQSTVAYDAIDYNYAAAVPYSDELDVIGFDWKTYNFDVGIYVTNFNKVFVLKSVDDRFYKLRFLDFYDVNGLKGTPSFELQELVP